MQNTPIKDTQYQLKEENNQFTVYKNNKIEAKGFNDEESSLHAVWVIEGKVYDHFYVADEDGIVSRVDRGLLWE